MSLRGRAVKEVAGAVILVAVLLSFPLASAQEVPLSYSWLSAYEEAQSIANRIAPPPDYHRVPSEERSYAAWLRALPLKPGCPPVMLYNGKRKGRQDVHAAVVDMDVGGRNLQQCADAVMRLRAEYLYGTERRGEIAFHFTNGDIARYSDWASGLRPVVKGSHVLWRQSAEPKEDYTAFREYLDKVFEYAGTLSLSKELVRVPNVAEMRIGDVFMQGGSPGHVVMVVDMAVSDSAPEKKVFLLAQSFMPAQDVHILVNEEDPLLSPWYSLDFGSRLETPEWDFRAGDLMRFPIE